MKCICLKNCFVILSLLFLTAACVSQLDRSSDGQKNGAVSLSDLRVASFANSPMIEIYPALSQNRKHELSIFISPSCNFCANLFLDAYKDILSGKSKFENTYTRLIMIPRKPNDVRVVAGLMCVGHQNYPLAVRYYYQSINQLTGRRAISDKTMEAAYLTTLSKFDVSSKDRVACENNQTFGESISAMTAIAIQVRKKDKVPVIIYDGIYNSNHRYSSLKNRMR